MRAEQICMFDLLTEKPKLTKPIRLIELFAGYGSQNLALKYLGANYESWKICEWATKSIQAYKDLHHTDDDTDYSKELSFDEIKDKLFSLGISADYNKPMTYDQIKRKGEKWCRQVYNNIIATNNLVNIQQVKGSDLNVIDTDKYDYIMTYSFPCQDLSLAGKGKGMSKDSGTRSGMLWEVERILNECSLCGQLPQILLMENVPQVHAKKNIEDFNSWIESLKKLGYTSYYEDLNAKNFGIPQNRNRTFMISILNNWSSGIYEFPKGIELKLRLKDLLEDEVDEKYYLSDKIINFFKENSKKNEEVGNGFRFKPTTEEEANIAKTITTRAGGRMDDNFIETVGKIDCWHQRGFVYDPNNISPSICATDYKTPKLVKIEEAEIKQNRLYGIFDSENTRHQAGSVLDIEGLAPTLDTMQGGYRQPCVEIVKVGNYSPSNHNASTVVDSCGIAPTFMEHHEHIMAIVEEPQYSDYSIKKIQGNIVTEDVCGAITASAMQSFNHDNCHLVITKNTENYIEWEQKGRLDIDCRTWKENTVAPTTTTPKTKVLLNDLRIRKLTPLECWRLMGVQDQDFQKVSQNQSVSSLYHLAGDSIVCNVLISIFSQLL